MVRVHLILEDFLFDFWHQWDVQVYILEDCRVPIGEGALLRRHPPVDLLLHHLEKTLCINGVNVHLGLKTAILYGPGKWLTNDAIRSELGKTLVHSIEN